MSPLALRTVYCVLTSDLARISHKYLRGLLLAFWRGAGRRGSHFEYTTFTIQTGSDDARSRFTVHGSVSVSDYGQPSRIA